MPALKMKLKTLLSIGFSAIAIILSGVIGASFMTFNKAVSANAWVSHTYQVVDLLKDTLILLDDSETGQRGYLYTDQIDFLEPYTKNSTLVGANFDKLDTLVSDNPTQLERSNKLRDLAKQKISELAQTIQLQRTGKSKEAFAVVMSLSGKSIMDHYRVLQAEMIQEEQNLLIERVNQSKKTQTYLEGVILLGGAFVILMIAIIYILITRKVILPVTDAVKKITTAIAESGAQVTQQDAVALSQLSAITNMSSSLSELLSTSRNTEINTNSTSHITEQAKLKVDQGSSEVKKTFELIQVFTKKIDQLRENVKSLAEQSEKIDVVSKLVKSLSEEINMLALNAAVEAARVGELGKGFTVISDEIRKLADESKQSAESTRMMLDNIQKTTKSSVIVSEEGSQMLEEISSLADSVSSLFEELSQLVGSVNMNSQNIASSTIQESAALGQLSQASMIIADGAQNSASGIGQVKENINQLNNVINTLGRIF